MTIRLSLLLICFRDSTLRQGLGSVCFLSPCDLFYWPWVFSPPRAGGGGKQIGLCETLLCEPLWELSSQHNISCHHATLMDVQAAFPSQTPVTRVKGEEKGCLLLPTCSVPGSLVCVISRHINGSMG